MRLEHDFDDGRQAIIYEWDEANRVARVWEERYGVVRDSSIKKYDDQSWGLTDYEERLKCV